MNQDDIIRMAREAGASHDGPLFVPDSFALRFAALVAAAERDACAKAVEKQARYLGYNAHADAIAAAIRARGEE